MTFPSDNYGWCQHVTTLVKKGNNIFLNNGKTELFLHCNISLCHFPLLFCSTTGEFVLLFCSHTASVQKDKNVSLNFSVCVSWHPEKKHSGLHKNVMNSSFIRNIEIREAATNEHYGKYIFIFSLFCSTVFSY